MKRRNYSKLENKFSRMILDFWIDKNVTPDWILKVMLETAQTYVPKVDEYYENRTDYDNAEKFEQIKELWRNEEKLPVEVISAQIDELINLPGEDEDDA